MSPRPRFLAALFACALSTALFPALRAQTSGPTVRIAHGVLEGALNAEGDVRMFKGVPFAAPPVGALRWKPPQPVTPWTGVRRAVEFPARAMQGRPYDDMIFRDAGPSEDCLYLNLWLPAKPATAKLPVMVWIYGGGFIAGGTSEPRQDGTNLSKLGVIVVSMNYRMSVFGFLAHPELTAESGHNASGNYGLMDQLAALRWVKENIAAFGGDPGNVTIFGESAGSSSVCALVASPLARGLFHRAIGESGALFNPNRPLKTRAESEQVGLKFAQDAFGSAAIAALREKPAPEILAAALKLPQQQFGVNVDGYFLPADCVSIYAAGRQAHVPLLAGWNLDEGSQRTFFAGATPTLANYATQAKTRFGAHADAFLTVYTATNDAEAKRAAQDYAGDAPRVFSIRTWIETHRATGGAPVYAYVFEQTLPLAANARPGAEPIAPHAGEIEYVFRVLSAKNLPWRPSDHAVSELMAAYWTNFAKTGNPNGPGLPVWPDYKREGNFALMRFHAASAATPDTHRGRYEFLKKLGSPLP